MRTLGFLASTALLLFLGGSSVQSFAGDWPLAETVFQRIANLGQLAAAVAGVASGVGAVFRRSWASRWALTFAAALAFTAWAGPVAWGESGVFRSLADGGLGFLLGFLLYLGVRQGVRQGGAEDSREANRDPRG